MIQSHLGYSVNFFSIFVAGAISLIIQKSKIYWNLKTQTYGMNSCNPIKVICHSIVLKFTCWKKDFISFSLFFMYHKYDRKINKRHTVYPTKWYCRLFYLTMFSSSYWRWLFIPRHRWTAPLCQRKI